MDQEQEIAEIKIRLRTLIKERLDILKRSGDPNGYREDLQRLLSDIDTTTQIDDFRELCFAISRVFKKIDGQFPKGFF